MKTEAKSILFGLILAGLLVLGMFIFDAGCFIRNITGLPCPGCGLTRGLFAALGGDLAGAFRMHPLFWLPPLLLAAILLLTLLKPEKLRGKKASRIWLACAVIYLAVYVVRMILLFPDHEPLTYDRASWFGRIGELVRWLNP